MKISVIVATRGRPQRAGGVVECARNLLSGRHDVEFIVAHDADDQRSIDYFASFEGITPYVQPRPIGVGDVWNRAARAHPADIYLALCDDAWMVTPGWEAFMVNALLQGIAGNLSSAQLGIVAFYDAAQPEIASIFGMTERWVETNGFIFDPRFPFWFGDSALVETTIFANGAGMPGTASLQFASMPGNVNPRLRDMVEVWWPLFVATRHERVATGRKLARKAGLREIDDYEMGALIAQCEERDTAGLRNVPGVLASIQHPKAPDAEYLAAKAAALIYLRSSAHVLHGNAIEAEAVHYPVAIPAAGPTDGIPPT